MYIEITGCLAQVYIFVKITELFESQYSVGPYLTLLLVFQLKTNVTLIVAIGATYFSLDNLLVSETWAQ